VSEPEHIDESWYTKPQGIEEQVSAGGLVARKRKGTVEILLVTDGGIPGHVIPKGKLEAGESLLAAAEREIFEETGFRGLRKIKYLGSRERLDWRKTCWKSVHYFLFEAGASECLEQQPAEHPAAPAKHQAAWFSLEDLPKLFWPEQRDLIETISRTAAVDLGMG